MTNFIKALVSIDMFMLALFAIIFVFLAVWCLIGSRFDLTIRSLLYSIYSLLLWFLLESLKKYL